MQGYVSPPKEIPCSDGTGLELYVQVPVAANSTVTVKRSLADNQAAS